MRAAHTPLAARAVDHRRFQRLVQRRLGVEITLDRVGALHQQQAGARPAGDELGAVLERFDMNGAAGQAMRNRRAAAEIAIDEEDIVGAMKAIGTVHSSDPHYLRLVFFPAAIFHHTKNLFFSILRR